ncbi:SRPBCC domain-containing protein [Bacillus sp. CGMCC 1.16607]|uniref:SRPBCC domain-containing protein n=1 Tax=Bacillus sp. CGMCC 1.16607 TaxID=3351842 RepID=UPI003625FE9C
MENNITNKLIVTTEGKVLVMERIFNAPRELVFKAFSEPQHLANWWGPKGWQTENLTFEFKPNGVWHYCMRCIDKNQGDFYGYEAWGKAIYNEIKVPEKIILTDVFSDKDGNTIEGMPTTVVTMSFIEQDGKTKLIMRSEYATVEGLQQVMEMGVTEGTASQYERLDDLLVELQ